MKTYESIDRTIDLLGAHAIRDGHRPFMVFLDRESFDSFTAGVRTGSGHLESHSVHHGAGGMMVTAQFSWGTVPVYALLNWIEGQRTVQLLDIYGRTRYMDVAREVRCIDPAWLARFPRIPPEPGNPVAPGSDEE